MRSRSSCSSAGAAATRRRCGPCCARSQGSARRYAAPADRVPAPGVLACEVRAAEVAVEAVVDAVGLAGEDAPPLVGQRDRRGRERAGVAERRRRRQLADQRLQTCEAAPDPGIAVERRLLARLVRGEQLVRQPRAVCEQLEQLTLAARQSRRHVGELLEQAAEGRREVRQRGAVLPQKRLDRGRLGRGERAPPRTAELDDRRRELTAPGPERLQARRIELAQEDCWIDELLEARSAAGEDLEQLQLVVEVVLEPEDDVLRAGEQIVTALQGMEDRVARPPAAPAEKGRASRARFRWALVENVGPAEHGAAEGRLPERV